MIHLITRLPLPYQRALCRTLHDELNGNFCAWFGERESDEFPFDGHSRELQFPHYYLAEVGYGELWRRLREHRDAVVILGGWSSPMTNKTLLMTTVLRVRVFIWADHPHPTRRNALTAALRRLYLRQISRRLVRGFLACGQMTVDYLVKLGISQDKIFNFPYWVAVPEEWSLPSKCARNSTQSSPLRLVAIGRQVPAKAFHVAIEAVALANKRAERKIATLNLIGDGPERITLEKLARALGVEQTVTFTGWIRNEEVWRCLRNADAVVVPSTFEPYGVIVLEALANGRPVLASKGVTAAIDRDDGSGAILFHGVEDSESLAQQMTVLAKNKDVLKIASQAARAIAERWRPERAMRVLAEALGGLNE